MGLVNTVALPASLVEYSRYDVYTAKLGFSSVICWVASKSMAQVANSAGELI